MDAGLLLGAIAAYFLVVFGISRLALLGRRRDAETYYLAGRTAPWGLVAIGMVGASLSGVTFISIPGDVGIETFAGSGRLREMAYVQLALGYVAGYLFVAFALLPLYYRLRLTTIYEYLSQRFGRRTYVTGSLLFILSRALGSSVRLYLAVNVLQTFVLAPMGVPFWLSTALTLAFILGYSLRGGIQSILWTDVFQTLFMLGGLVATILFLLSEFEAGNLFSAVANSGYGRVFDWDAGSPYFFVRQFIAGMLITIVMTGLDQDMMQKNLACRDLRSAQKNMLVMAGLLTVAILLFTSLGALLYQYAAQIGFTPPENRDLFFPQLALAVFPQTLGLVVFLALIAAAYSSADGTITALTTATCVDILRLPNDDTRRTRRVRTFTHVGYTVLFFLLTLAFYELQHGGLMQTNVITIVLTMAGYTYGPLLGMYAVGLYSGRIFDDRWTPYIAVAAPLAGYLLREELAAYAGYRMGFEILAVNGALTVIFLLFCSQRKAS